jgi:DNA invertase Pin-like site-specific DNA recombinase
LAYSKRTFRYYCCVNVIGYVRVSTAEQADSGAGLEAQRATILAEADRRQWNLIEVIEDAGVTGAKLRRPGLDRALLRLEHREAQGILVAKLDRLSRSLLDFAGLMELARRKGWAIIALDLGVDTTSASGEMLANVVATFAKFERRLISERTKDALAVRRKQGVRLGRPPSTPPRTVRQIQRWREAGDTYAAIADRLNARQVPTSQGGLRWHPATVRAVALRSQTAQPISS